MPSHSVCCLFFCTHAVFLCPFLSFSRRLLSAQEHVLREEMAFTAEQLASTQQELKEAVHAVPFCVLFVFLHACCLSLSLSLFFSSPVVCTRTCVTRRNGIHSAAISGYTTGIERSGTCCPILCFVCF